MKLLPNEKITPDFLSDKLDEMAEYYGSITGYSSPQKQLLFKRLALLTCAEVTNAFELIRTQVERFPNPVLVLMHTRPMESDAASRKKAEIIRKSGQCDWCHSTGMVIVYDRTSMTNPSHEITMRCGECEIAVLLGVLKNCIAWKKDLQDDFEPTILGKSWPDIPPHGRLDEILSMTLEDRQEVFRKEPWVKMALMFYGTQKKRATNPATYAPAQQVRFGSSR